MSDVAALFSGLLPLTPPATLAHVAAGCSYLAVLYAYLYGTKYTPGREYYTLNLPSTYLLLYTAYHLGGRTAVVAATITMVMLTSTSRDTLIAEEPAAKLRTPTMTRVEGTVMHNRRL